MSRMPLRGRGWLGDGRDVYIENKENRFADRNALGERISGDNKDNSGQLFQGAGRTTPPGWMVRMESGREEEDKQDKGNKESGRRAGKRKLRAWIEGRFAGGIHALIPVSWRAILPSDEPNAKRCI